MNRTLPVLALAVSGLLALSACGSAKSAATDAQAQQGGYGTQGQGGQAAQSGQAGFPGASGQVAAVQGSTLQVQGQQGQTAVSYTSTTAITQQVTGTLADVKVGTCVTVTPSQTGSSTQPSATTVTAGSVRVTAKTDGSCTGGFGGGGFGGRSGTGSRPSGMPSRQPGSYPSSGASGRPKGGFGFGTSGEVTAVNGSGFTVAAVQFKRGSQGSSASAAPSTSPVTVTVSSSTTYTSTRTATSAALKVGECVTATGKSDDTGAINASRIAVSAPVDGECTAGFGRFGGAMPGGAPGQGGASS